MITNQLAPKRPAPRAPTLRQWLETRGQWGCVVAALSEAVAENIGKFSLSELLRVTFHASPYPEGGVWACDRETGHENNHLWMGVPEDRITERHYITGLPSAIKVTDWKDEDFARFLNEVISAWSPGEALGNGEFLLEREWRWHDRRTILEILRQAPVSIDLTKPLIPHWAKASGFRSAWPNPETGWQAWQRWRAAQAPLVQVVTERMLPPDLKSQIYGWRPRKRDLNLELFCAARYSVHKNVKKLLAQGADPNQEIWHEASIQEIPVFPDGICCTFLVRDPLAVAQDKEIIEMLIKGGADVGRTLGWIITQFQVVWPLVLEIGIRICWAIVEKFRGDQWFCQNEAARQWLPRISEMINSLRPCEDMLPVWVRWHGELDRVSVHFGVIHNSCPEATALRL